MGPSDQCRMARGWKAIRIVVTVSSVLDLIAVLVLPWRWLGIGNPFHLGSHLYQMHLPLLMTALIALAVATFIGGQTLRRGIWPTAVLLISGVGTTLLSLVVASSSAYYAAAVNIPVEHLPLGYGLACANGAS